MRTQDHTDAYDRLCREVESRLWWRQWGSLVRSVAAGLGLALAAWLLVQAEDCGNVPNAAADPVPAEEPHPAASQGIPVDPEAFALAGRFAAWQPLWRERHPGELAEMASAVLRACRENPWPSAERCPDLLLALAFKESSLRANARGRRGEIGLVQLMPGAATAGETREAAADPDVNLRLGLTWLRRCAALCRMAGRDSVEAALSAYAGMRCGPSRGAALVLRWETALRAGGAS